MIKTIAKWSLSLTVGMGIGWLIGIYTVEMFDAETLNRLDYIEQRLDWLGKAYNNPFEQDAYPNIIAIEH